MSHPGFHIRCAMLCRCLSSILRSSQQWLFLHYFRSGTATPSEHTSMPKKNNHREAPSSHLFLREVVSGVERNVSRFARHPRFILWACNIYFRHRTLDQGDIYLQQNPGDANKTIEEIQSMLEETQSANLINNIRRYMANIPGSPSYWFNAAAELDAIIDSRGPPHFFFTFTYADR